MKTKETAQKQAHKILSYYMEKSGKLRKKHDDLYNKKRPKSVEVRIKRWNNLMELKEQAENLESRGRRAWAFYLNNPKYW